MKRLLLASLAICSAGLGFSKSVFAQTSLAYSKPVVTMDDDGARHMIIEQPGTDLPQINQPQSGWSQVADIIDTDGTAPTTSCGTYPIIAILQAGILEAANQQFQGISLTGGFGQMFNGVNLSPVWVHESHTGRMVCDTTATLLMSDGSNAGLTPEEYQFETFAKDGAEYVQFQSNDGD